MKRKIDEITLTYDVVMIRRFVKELHIHELRATFLLMEFMPMNLSRKQMMGIVESFLIGYSKKFLMDRIIKLIEHAIQDCDKISDSEERSARRTMLITKMANVANKAKSNQDKMDVLESMYRSRTMFELRMTATRYSMYVLNSCSKEVRTEFPEIQPAKEESQCTICFEMIAPIHQIQTECKHVYCAGCTVTFIESQSRDSSSSHMTCAMCRHPMTCIFV
jgi:hypothetical protein